MRKRKLELTPMKVKRGLPPRWRKVHKGVIYYYRGEYQEALRQWHQKLVELEAKEGEPPEKVVERLEATLAQMDNLGIELTDQSHISIHRVTCGDETSLWANAGPEGQPPTLRFNDLGPPTSSAPKTIKDAVKAFLAHKEAQTTSGRISTSWWEVMRCSLDRFTEWFGAYRSLPEITEQVLAGYWLHLTTLIGEGKFSPKSGRTALQVLRQWIKFHYENGALEREPRNIRSRELVINVPAKPIAALPAKEVRRLLGLASGRMKLFITLSLNAAFTQVDLAALHPGELDLDAGQPRLIRRRTKTRHLKTPPVVSYPLWPQVVEMLRQNKSGDPEHVFLNDNGRPLVAQMIVKGKLKRIDNVNSMFDRFVHKHKLTVSFKVFRKSGATILSSNAEFAPYVGRYLGHSPRDTASRFYVGVDQSGFDRAIAWLGQQVLGDGGETAPATPAAPEPMASSDGESVDDASPSVPKGESA
ncbi:MAG: hypothetical protein ABSG53_20450 [Thermoguttaceae bacterium]